MTRSFLPFFLVILLCGANLPGREALPGLPKEPEPELLALKQVHPDNDDLLRAIEAGRKKVPPGYFIVPRRVIDPETGEEEEGHQILLRRKNVIATEDVEKAFPSPHNPDQIMVRLNAAGGKKLEAATQQMRLGVDRLAIVVKGQCLLAPTVAAILTDAFAVAGLTRKGEIPPLVEALNAKAKK